MTSQTPAIPPSSLMVDVEKPWLLQEVDLYGQVTFTIRACFWAVTGPQYFGPFLSQEEAEAFYQKAQDLIGETIVELHNLLYFRDVPTAPDEAAPLVGEA